MATSIMKSSKIDKRKYPIDILRDDMLGFIESFLPDLHEMIKDEIKYNDLSRNFVYKYCNSPIKEVASIDTLVNGETQITFYDNYLQYLWCLSYSFIVFYDQLFKRSKNKEFNEIEFHKGLQVFQAGLSLLKTNDIKRFYSLPNPTETVDRTEYISKARSIFLVSFSYILCHEFGHQYLGHLKADHYTSEQSKEDEIRTDEFATSIFIDSLKQEYEWNKKCGIITALSSLIFLDNTLKGGSSHPDPDDRIKKCLIQLNLKPEDPLWSWASLFFIFWSYYYHSPIENIEKRENGFLDFEYISENCRKRKYE